MAPPFKSCSVDIMYGLGVSSEGELVDLASDANIIEKAELGMHIKGISWGKVKKT